MSRPVTAHQISQHLTPHDLNRITVKMPDGLRVVVAYMHPDEQDGAISLSDIDA